MKKLLFAAALAVLGTTGMSSCGTIAGALTSNKRPVFMMEAPRDLQVTHEGKKVNITSDAFASSSGGSVTTTWYTSSVRLPYKKTTTIELYSPSQNKKATVELKSKGSGGIIFLDLMFTGGVGVVIDVLTKNHKVLKPKYVDVQRALDGKPRNEWRSQGKLKRITKRKINRG